MNSRASRLKTILKEIGSGLQEKQEAIVLATLCSLAGESIFFLGPPGVAKSMIARRLKLIFEGGSAFEYLMNRFSTPDEIFGPISIMEFKEGKYKRLTYGYLPAVDVVFLDEIWKASPSIQNTLLTVLNEKIFRNGETEEKIPLKALIAASNELPEPGQGLEALWDRFLIRYPVLPIEDAEAFEEMITARHSVIPLSVTEPVSETEYEEWQERIESIEVPREVLSIIHVIRVKIKEYNEQLQEPDEFLYVSDRRWRKIVRLLRASAWFNDRDSVDLMDTFLIAHCIWQKPEQLDWAKDTVCDAIKQHGYTFQSEIGAIQKEIENFKKEVDLEISQVKQQHKEVIDFKQDKSYIDLLCELKLTNGESLILEESDYKLINENNQSIVRNTRYGQFEISKSQKKNYVLVKNTTRNIYSRMPSQEEVALPVKKYSKK